MSTIRLTIVENYSSGYKYLVTKDSSSWTAFRTYKGVRRFLNDYGLIPKLEERNGTWATFKLEGNFIEHMIWDKEVLLKLYGEESFRLSNGDYTLWKIVTGREGKSLFYLNPNVKDRPVTEYFQE